MFNVIFSKNVPGFSISECSFIELIPLGPGVASEGVLERGSDDTSADIKSIKKMKKSKVLEIWLKTFFSQK